MKQVQSVSKVSTGTCEMLREGLQDFSSPPTSRRAPKKKEKARTRKVQSLNQMTLHVGTAVSSCEVRLLAGLTNAQFQRAQLHKNTLHVGAANSSVQSDTLAGLTNHGFNALNSNTEKGESKKTS